MSRNNDIDKKQEDTWTKRGIVARKFDSYDEIPGWLFELCRLAAVKRMEQH